MRILTIVLVGCVKACDEKRFSNTVRFTCFSIYSSIVRLCIGISVCKEILLYRVVIPYRVKPFVLIRRYFVYVIYLINPYVLELRGMYWFIFYYNYNNNSAHLRLYKYFISWDCSSSDHMKYSKFLGQTQWIVKVSLLEYSLHRDVTTPTWRSCLAASAPARVWNVTNPTGWK